MLENYEGTAIDTSVFEETSQEAEQQTEEVAATVVPQTEEPAEEIATEEPTTPSEFDIPGVGKMTVDEIIELKKSGLRQADYTRKTQELARQREELAQAKELFDYLRANPHLIEAMKQAEQNPYNRTLSYAAPENELLQKLAYQQKSLEIDMKLNALKSKYGDVDEVALFQKAAELNTDDLEFVWKGLQADAIDRQALIEEAKAQLKAELEANKNAVSTTVTTTQTQPVSVEPPLTEQQKRVAAAMGLTEEEYRKWL